METRIRAVFEQREVVLPGDESWVPAPSAGVQRKMLDRIGDEVARATSFVRFAANTEFPEHVHGGGEEFLVLEGVISDARGDYPAGTYVRNPLGSKHAPRAGSHGATLFVKLHQFAAYDTARVVVHTPSAPWQRGSAAGLTVLPLHAFGAEHVALVRWAPYTRFHRHAHPGGEEILVLDGVFRDAQGAYPAGSWIRNPHMSTHTPFTEAEGATIFVKGGHLPPNPAAFESGLGSSEVGS